MHNGVSNIKISQQFVMFSIFRTALFSAFSLVCECVAISIFIPQLSYYFLTLPAVAHILCRNKFLQCVLHDQIVILIFLVYISVLIDQIQLENVESFKYLGSTLTNYGRISRNNQQDATL